jgi:WD40 repeat protein
LKIWDVASGRVDRDISGRMGWLFRLAFAPGGRRVATVGDTPDGRPKAGVKGEVIVWDVTTGREILSLPGRMCVAFSRDGRRLAAMAATRAVKIWDASTGREERVRTEFAGVINSVTFSPDGSRLAAGGGDFRKPGEVLVWNLETGRILHQL